MKMATCSMTGDISNVSSIGEKELPPEYDVDVRKLKEGLPELLKYQLNLIGDAIEFGPEDQIDSRMYAYRSSRATAIMVELDVKESDRRFFTYVDLRKKK